MKKLIPLLLIILVIASCSSGPKKIDETLNPVELFQLAQEASDNKDYGTAVKYYEVFISKYSDDIQHLVEAEYEIAFITYKQGNLLETGGSNPFALNTYQKTLSAVQLGHKRVHHL